MKELGRSGIEAYLKRRVKENGGETCKLSVVGRRNRPDQLVMWPFGNNPAIADFIETKAPGKTASSGQCREHQRLVEMGFKADVLDTKEKIEEYIQGVAKWQGFTYRPPAKSGRRAPIKS